MSSSSAKLKIIQYKVHIVESLANPVESSARLKSFCRTSDRLKVMKLKVQLR